MAGDDEFLYQHSASRAWLAEHPQLDESVWRRGIEFQEELRNVGVVQIVVEQNALEALKLGTYFGSCLGLGGD